MPSVGFDGSICEHRPAGTSYTNTISRQAICLHYCYFGKLRIEFPLWLSEISLTKTEIIANTAMGFSFKANFWLYIYSTSCFFFWCFIDVEWKLDCICLPAMFGYETVNNNKTKTTTLPLSHCMRKNWPHQPYDNSFVSVWFITGGKSIWNSP